MGSSFGDKDSPLGVALILQFCSVSCLSLAGERLDLPSRIYPCFSPVSRGVCFLPRLPTFPLVVRRVISRSFSVGSLVSFSPCRFSFLSLGFGDSSLFMQETYA